MPYLKLGKTELNYSGYEDNFIITMILDTSCSYQYPILVRDTPTLDVYFGKTFKYRDFINEMFTYGVTFYLYRPIELMAPEKSWTDELRELRELGVDDEFIPDDRSLMPSNFIIPENSPSWRNRDTLRLFNNTDVNNGFSFDHCYPKYGKDYRYYKKDGSSYVLGLGGAENNIDMNQINEGYETLAFKLNFPDNFESKDFLPDSTGSCRYIVMPYLGYNYLIWFDDGSHNEPEIENIKSSMYINLYDELGELKDKEALFDELIQLLTEDFSLAEPFGLGYELVDKSYDKSTGHTFILSKKRRMETWNVNNIRANIQTPEKNYHYYNVPQMTLTNDFQRTNDLLSEATEDIKQLEFYSKTIGKGEDDIRIKIEKLRNQLTQYRITISRFDYVEYFNVNVTGTEYPLVSTINKGSKLVSCKLFDRTHSLPEGEYVMRGSYIEEYSYENRRQSLDIIKETEINDDVLLIDDLELWKSDATVMGEDLKLFLEYSIYKDNQTYITNRSHRSVDPLTGGYNVYHEHRYNITDEDRWIRGLLTVRNNLHCNIDIILNVGDLEERISDKQNRLVYFYNDMTLMDSYRPGCYAFLKGLLTDIYSVESSYIIYDVPSDTVIQELPEHKCNYMLYNNSYYYYPRYQNGDMSKITTVTRFMVSKIGRVFRSKKWRLINMPMYEVMKVIDDTISSLRYRFSILRSLELEDVEVSNNTVALKLKSEINELSTKDVTLDVTLNYT